MHCGGGLWYNVGMTARYPSSIREEELKNKVAADFFGAFDCTRIIGNVDFCVAAKRSARPESLYWAEAKNHPTDVHQMLAQLILTIGRAASPLAAAAGAGRQPYHADEPPKFAGCFDNEKIAFVEYHHILPVFNLNDFNWTQTPSAVDGKTVETVRGVVPSDKIVVFRFGADDAEIKAFIRRNFTSGEGPALATPIDRNNFTFIYQKWRAEVMPHIDAPWDVSVVHVTYDRYLEKIGIAGRELFAQFFMRIHDEIPGCVLAEFSKLKHLQSPNFKAFRQAFRGTLEKCFIVPADTFDNVKGDFPIGFFVWRLEDLAFATGRIGDWEVGRDCKQTPKLQVSQSPSSESNSTNGVFTSTVADVYDRKGKFICTKTILAYDDVANIGKWVNSFRHDDDVHLGFMSNGRNDFQNTNLVYFINDRNQLSTPRGWWMTPPNLIPMCIFVAVRHSVKATWLNDRDTFLYPNDGWQNDFGFQSDCLVYTLFSDFNAIKCKYGVNHWIPFTEEEVGAKDCFASHFMSDWLAGRGAAAVAGRPPYQEDLFAATGETPVGLVNGQDARSPSCEAARAPLPRRAHFVEAALSLPARAVMDTGRELWRYYHAQPGANPNASYYDIRLHFQGVKRTSSGKEQMNATSADETYNRLLAALRAAHKALAAQIAPKVYEYRFLKR